MHEPLDSTFYDRDPVAVARELLGKTIVRTMGEDLTTGRIVEVEAYLKHGDSASHAYCGRRRRNASMFGPPGHAYVYAIHARFCLNVVTEPEDVPSAVLIRAVEPLSGLELMEKRRSTDRKLNLTRGPARLCEAFAVDRSLDGWNLTIGEQLWLTNGGIPAPKQIAISVRIGVTSAKDLRLRFFINDSRYISR